MSPSTETPPSRTMVRRDRTAARLHQRIVRRDRTVGRFNQRIVRRYRTVGRLHQLPKCPRRAVWRRGGRGPSFRPEAGLRLGVAGFRFRLHGSSFPWVNPCVRAAPDFWGSIPTFTASPPSEPVPLGSPRGAASDPRHGPVGKPWSSRIPLVGLLDVPHRLRHHLDLTRHLSRRSPRAQPPPL